jgi:hypothetical protein
MNIQNYLFAAFTALSSSSLILAADPTDVSVYFQNWAIGSSYDQSKATTDWKSLKYWDSTTLATIKQYDSVNNYRALRVKLPKDAYGGNSGMIWQSDLADGTDYTFEYKVYFEPGFEFNRGNSSTAYGGGKLPGLTGGNNPSGGGDSSGGMSSRIMFRRDPKHNTGSTGGYIELYQYWQGQASTYGDSVFLQNVNAGSWYIIKQRVQLGTSTSDGRIRVWVNGTKKIDKNYRYLKSGQTWKINGIMQHVFCGGNTSAWGPVSDRYLMLDNMKVSKTVF